MKFLTVKQFSKEHPAFSEGFIRWLLFKDSVFRQKCVRKMGRRVLLSEEDVLSFVNAQREDAGRCLQS